MRRKKPALTAVHFHLLPSFFNPTVWMFPGIRNCFGCPLLSLTCPGKI